MLNSLPMICFGPWGFLYENLPISFFPFAWLLLRCLLKLPRKTQKIEKNEALWSISRKRPHFLQRARVCSECSMELWFRSCSNWATEMRWGPTAKLGMWADKLKKKFFDLFCKSYIVHKVGRKSKKDTGLGYIKHLFDKATSKFYFLLWKTCDSWNKGLLMKDWLVLF